MAIGTNPQIEGINALANIVGQYSQQKRQTRQYDIEQMNQKLNQAQQLYMAKIKANEDGDKQTFDFLDAQLAQLNAELPNRNIPLGGWDEQKAAQAQMRKQAEGLGTVGKLTGQVPTVNALSPYLSSLGVGNQSQQAPVQGTQGFKDSGGMQPGGFNVMPDANTNGFAGMFTDPNRDVLAREKMVQDARLKTNTQVSKNALDIVNRFPNVSDPNRINALSQLAIENGIDPNGVIGVYGSMPAMTVKDATTTGIAKDRLDLMGKTSEERIKLGYAQLKEKAATNEEKIALDKQELAQKTWRDKTWAKYADINASTARYNATTSRMNANTSRNKASATPTEKPLSITEQRMLTKDIADAQRTARTYQDLIDSKTPFNENTTFEKSKAMYEAERDASQSLADQLADIQSSRASASATPQRVAHPTPTGSAQGAGSGTSADPEFTDENISRLIGGGADPAKVIQRAISRGVPKGQATAKVNYWVNRTKPKAQTAKRTTTTGWDVSAIK